MGQGYGFTVEQTNKFCKLKDVLKFKIVKFCHGSLPFLKQIPTVFNSNLNFRHKPPEKFKTHVH